MITHTAERQELYKMIDALPDDSVIAMRDLIRSLRPGADDGYLPHIPNAETVAAIEEGRAGKVKRFSSVEALMADLNDGKDD